MALGAAARFVRDVLGCACPAELLERVSMRREAGTLGGLPLRCTIEVGGRLLVCVAGTADAATVSAALAEVAREARERRDAGGFHRFRFVVAARDAARLRRALPPGFDGLPGADDRLHLHVVDEDDLPATDTPGASA